MHGGIADMRYNDLLVQLYLDAAQRLAADLKLSSIDELGTLSDSIICSHAANVSAPKLLKVNLRGSNGVKRKPSWSNRLLARNSSHAMEIGFSAQRTRQNTTVVENAGGLSPVSDDYEKAVGCDHLSRENCDDVHLFFVRRLQNSSKDTAITEKLLSHGFRLTEPVFIAKIMGSKLRIPAETMLQYFNDMQRMALTCESMALPIAVEQVDSNAFDPQQQEQSPPAAIENARPFTNAQLRGGVHVGLLALVKDDRSYTHDSSVIVDKNRRYSFPIVPLRSEDSTHILQLGREERSCINGLHGQSLLDISALVARLDHEETTTKLSATSSTSDLIKGRQQQQPKDENPMDYMVTCSLFSSATILTGLQNARSRH